MENQTFNVLLLEGLKVTPQSSFPAFILLLAIYIFIILSNTGLVVLIAMERSLHQPMYLLFCNMSVNDAFGATTILPRLLSFVFIATTDRYITHVECAIQAFCAHFHAATAHTVLMIMAFDRYVAICNPLHYTNIMTNKMVLKLTGFAWGTPVVLVAILLGLTLRLTRCRWMIFNPFCDNASLFKLSCQNLLLNHIYGIGSAVVILGSSIGSIALTYLRIAIVCLSSKNRVINHRALQTCATHLSVYMIMLVACFMPLVLHRFPQWSDYRKLASISFYVFPPALNAIIYGLQMKEVRLKISTLFSSFNKNNKTTSMGVK